MIYVYQDIIIACLSDTLFELSRTMHVLHNIKAIILVNILLYIQFGIRIFISF
ncbi:hypothetical protein D3C77_611360 [compost metagenome]